VAGPDEKQALAAEIISKSWQDALDQGVEVELVASTALSASLSALVKTAGKDATVRIIKRLIGAVEDGRFDH
jgi:sugar-specific transcriptional regulator TrmB